MLCQCMARVARSRRHSAGRQPEDGSGDQELKHVPVLAPLPLHAPIPQAQQRRALMDHFFHRPGTRLEPVFYPVCQSVACPTPTYSACLIVCMISHRILLPHQASHNLRSTPRSYFVHRRAALLRSSTLHFAGCILCLELAYGAGT